MSLQCYFKDLLKHAPQVTSVDQAAYVRYCPSVDKSSSNRGAWDGILKISPYRVQDCIEMRLQKRDYAPLIIAA